MNYNAPKMMKRPKGQKGKKPHALKPCPSVDRIFVVQFQFFDNGQNSGEGSTRNAMMLTVYLAAKTNLSKPHWKRSVALIEPSDFWKWADRALGEGRLTPEQHSMYAEGYEVIVDRAQHPETEWAKLGCIEDKRAHADYPGRFIMAYRNRDGEMGCHSITETGTMSCKRFIYDQRTKPGTGRRKAFGFYDPCQIYNAKGRKLGALSAGGTVHWHWVRGHNGHAGNERPDGLATRGMREARDTV